MHSFACPHCSAPLRIRDRSLFARPIDCPDCGGPFRIEPDGRNGIRVVMKEQVDPSEPDGGATVANHAIRSTIRAEAGRTRNRKRHGIERTAAGRPADRPATAHRRSRSFLPVAGALLRLRQAVLTPVGISWLAAGIAGLGLLFAIRPWSREDVPPAIPHAAPAAAAEADSPRQASRDPLAESDSSNVAEPVPPAIEARLPDAPPDANGPPDPEVAERVDDPPPLDPPAPLPAPAEPPAIAAAEPPAEPDAPEMESELEPPPVAAPPQTIDVVQALAQPIRKFDQSRAVPVRDLLLLIEEMTAVPIRYDRFAGGRRHAAFDRPVSLVLDRTTAGGILDAVVAQADLAYEIHADGIELRPAEPAAPRAAQAVP